MTGTQVAILVSVIVVMDLLVVAVILNVVVRGTWGDLEKKYPAQEPEPGSVRRTFQSVSINLLNLGGCVHMTADPGCLHMEPSRIMRWLRMRPVSIPWEAITVPERKPGWKRRLVAAKLPGGTTLRIPLWAAELAAPPSAEVTQSPQRT